MSEQYYKEVKDHSYDEKVFMLLGNKSDLESVVSTDQGHEAASKMGALYLEVSARNNENLDNIFDEIATLIIKRNLI